MDLAACLGTLLQGFVQSPDYSELYDTCAKHEYVLLKCFAWNETNSFIPRPSQMYRIKHVHHDCVFVERIDFAPWISSRFETRVIEFSKWTTYFEEWIEEESDDYNWCEFWYWGGIEEVNNLELSESESE